MHSPRAPAPRPPAWLLWGGVQIRGRRPASPGHARMVGGGSERPRQAGAAPHLLGPHDSPGAPCCCWSASTPSLSAPKLLRSWVPCPHEISPQKDPNHVTERKSPYNVNFHFLFFLNFLSKCTHLWTHRNKTNPHQKTVLLLFLNTKKHTSYLMGIFFFFFLSPGGGPATEPGLAAPLPRATGAWLGRDSGAAQSLAQAPRWPHCEPIC